MRSLTTWQPPALGLAQRSGSGGGWSAGEKGVGNVVQDRPAPCVTRAQKGLATLQIGGSWMHILVT